MPDIRPHVEEGRILPRGPAGAMAAAAEALPALDDAAFGRKFDRFGDARVVLLGASSDGTSEFHRARAAITRWLIENRGFDIVALQADWSDGQAIDAAVRGRKAPPGAPFSRGAAWVWRNREFDAFVRWLADHNSGRPRGAQAALCGLDLYDLDAALGAVVDHLDRADPEAAAVVRARYACPMPWVQEPAANGRTAVSGRYAACEGAVTALVADRLRRRIQEAPHGDGALLDGAGQRRLTEAAERFYRAMYYGGGEAWNQRCAHAFEVLQALLATRSDARVVVWAHNALVGDARATEMGLVRDHLSLGQLCREAYGDEARLIGFGTHAGEVACAPAWESPPETVSLRPSSPPSHERQSHDAGLDRFLLDLRPGATSALRRALAEPRPERFIGPLYQPESERWSHYAECRLPEQFDAWVWFDQTTAVTPLPRTGEPEMWPFRL